MVHVSISVASVASGAESVWSNNGCYTSSTQGDPVHRVSKLAESVLAARVYDRLSSHEGLVLQGGAGTSYDVSYTVQQGIIRCCIIVISGVVFLTQACVVAGGTARLDYFRKVVAVPDASKTTLAWSFKAFGRSDLWVALITFLYLDFLDATGTLFSMGESL